MPPPPSSLPDDLIEEILLRVRADDPASLVRAALACTRWCRLVADPAFRRRRLQQLQHRGADAPVPPMLGFLSECDDDTQTTTPARRGWPQPLVSRFVPTSSCRPPRAGHIPGLQSFDARHGRVLLEDRANVHFVVWDPVTDHRVALPAPPVPPPRSRTQARGSTKPVVLCAAAATATGACGHLDCHRGPFVVVLVGTTGHIYPDYSDDDDDDEGVVPGPGKTFTCTYSSESGTWSDVTYYQDVPEEELAFARSALVGNNALFLKLSNYHKILKYDLSTQEMSMVRLPSACTKLTPVDLRFQFELTTLEDGRLGLVRMEDSNKLCMWSSWEVDGFMGWTLRDVIDLKKLFPLYAKHCRLVGVVEGVCVAFMAVHSKFMAVQERGLFAIDMKTGLMNKLSEDFGATYCVVPYTDFCTPALRAPSRGDEPVEETSPGNPR